MVARILQIHNQANHLGEVEVMPFRMGPWEIGLILSIILIVFGVGKLPQVGGAIGKGLRAFRKGQSGEEDEEEPPNPKGRPPRRQPRTEQRKI